MELSAHCMFFFCSLGILASARSWQYKTLIDNWMNLIASPIEIKGRWPCLHFVRGRQYAICGRRQKVEIPTLPPVCVSVSV